jgi:anti-sigma B factor antagonist
MNGPTKSDGWPAAELLTTRLVDAGVAVILHVHGEVDDSTAPELSAALGNAVAHARNRAVVVDLSGVSFIGSAGIAVLVPAAAASPESTAVPLHIATGDNRKATRPFATVGANQMAPLYSTLDEALAAVLVTHRQRQPAPEE